MQAHIQDKIKAQVRSDCARVLATALPDLGRYEMGKTLLQANALKPNEIIEIIQAMPAGTQRTKDERFFAEMDALSDPDVGPDVGALSEEQVEDNLVGQVLDLMGIVKNQIKSEK